MHKKLGQHILIDRAIAQREVEYAKVSKNDTVLEVGPGKGVLTLLLAKKAKKVIAVEIDRKFVDYLNTIVPQNVEIIHNDVLKMDLASIGFNKVVANLPFSISSPFTFKLLETPFSIAILTYQKQFAQRMVARPGSKGYSRLSIAIYYRANCRILESIPRRAFRPIPKVDASIVELKPRKKPPFHVINEPFFFSFLNLIFSQRRKCIGKVIKRRYGMIIDKTIFNKRAEELTPEEIGEISNYIIENLQAR